MTRYQRQCEIVVGSKVRVKNNTKRHDYYETEEMIQLREEGVIGTVTYVQRDFIDVFFPGQSRNWAGIKKEVELVE